MSDYNSNDGQDFDGLFDNSGFVSRSEAQKLAREEVSKTLRDIALFNSQAIAGQQAAIQEATAKHSDFDQRRSRMLAVLQEIPLLKDAVQSAENNPQLSSALPQIYEALYKASFAPTDNTAAASEPSARNLGSQGASETDLSSEGVQYQAALASQRVNLSPENRKTILADLERRGVLDIEF